MAGHKPNGKPRTTARSPWPSICVWSKYDDSGPEGASRFLLGLVTGPLGRPRLVLPLLPARAPSLGSAAPARSGNMPPPDPNCGCDAYSRDRKHEYEQAGSRMRGHVHHRGRVPRRRCYLYGRMPGDQDQRDASDSGAERDPRQQHPAAIGLDRLRRARAREARLNTCGYFLVNLLKERCHYRVAVLRSEFLGYLSSGADIFR
jgi:hypothetical protein